MGDCRGCAAVLMERVGVLTIWLPVVIIVVFADNSLSLLRRLSFLSNARVQMKLDEGPCWNTL